MKCKTIIRRLEEKYPLTFAEKWDNVGLLVGDEEKEVSRIFLALDVTSDVLKKASDWGADMIITHHPLIFSEIKQIIAQNYLGTRIIQLIKQDIAYYAMHTNYDVCKMADLSAQILQLSDTSILEVTFDDGTHREGIGRVGKLPKVMTVRECAGYVKERLELSHVTVYGDLNRKVELAAISAGSGKSMVNAGVKKGAEVLITGDIDYHTGIDAIEKGITIIDAGHYGTEYIFIEDLRHTLKEMVPELKIQQMEVVHPEHLI